MNIRKNIKYSFSVLLSFVLLSLGKNQAYAQVTTPWNDKCVEQGVATIVGIECLVTNILNIAVTGVGLVSAIMLFVGAILMLTSEGNPKGVEAAKKTIMYAILGLVLAISAWVILNFISVFTGNTNILQFGVQEIQQ